MTLLLASALLAAVAGLIVVMPILTRRVAVLRDVTAGAILDADARKRVALSELKELEYEFLGGKLDENDYHELRDRLTSEAVAAVRAAEAARASAVPVIRADGSPAGGPGAVRAPAEGREWPTHTCGFANPDGSRFCAGCGARLV